MKKIPDSLNDDEIIALGINPKSVFASCPRIKDAPLDIRIGKNRLTRRTGGEVCLSIGEYSPERVEKYRRRMINKS